VTEGRKRRRGLRLKTEMWIAGLPGDDGPGWEGWRIGLKRKLGGENKKLLLKYTAHENVVR
jgi:hypothetical protein